MAKQSAHPAVVLIFLLQVRRGRVMHSGRSVWSYNSLPEEAKEVWNAVDQPDSRHHERPWNLPSIGECCPELAQTDGGLFCFIVIG